MTGVPADRCAGPPRLGPAMACRTDRGRIRPLAAAAWVAGALAVALGAASAELSARPLPVDERTAVYYPDRFEWQRRTPQDAGMDAARLDEAVQFAMASENPATKDLTIDLATTFGRNEPFDMPVGSESSGGPMPSGRRSPSRLATS